MPDHLENVMQVVDYLKANGHRVSKSTVYNHVKAGRLPKTKEGHFTSAVVKKYATTLQVGSDGGVLDQAALSKKQAADLRKTIADAELREFKLGILSGKYVLKEQSEADKARLMTLMITDLENFLRAMADAQTAKVEGDRTLVPDLIDFNMLHFEKMRARWLNNVNRNQLIM